MVVDRRLPVPFRLYALFLRALGFAVSSSLDDAFFDLLADDFFLFEVVAVVVLVVRPLRFLPTLRLLPGADAAAEVEDCIDNPLIPAPLPPMISLRWFMHEKLDDGSVVVVVLLSIDRREVCQG